MGIKQQLAKCHDIDECDRIINSEVRKCITIFSHVYLTYDDQWREQIKIYQSDKGSFITVVRSFDNMKLSEVNVYFTSKRPLTPHPIFPTPCTFLENPTKMTFKRAEQVANKEDQKCEEQ